MMRWWMITNMMLLLTLDIRNHRDLPLAEAAGVAVLASLMGIPVIGWAILVEGE